MKFASLCALITLCAAALASTPQGAFAGSQRPVPLINVTDLYHPPQDPGDNVDLIAAYALPEVDLKAVILDVSEAFRNPVARHPGLGEDRDGPREGGFIPVTQLNSIFGRNVPCAVGPYGMMKSPEDKMLDVPAFQQEGIRLILKTLSESRERVTIVSFGSARPLAAAYNRDPKLFIRKAGRIHLSAGSSEPGFMEWNVLLDTNAIVCLLRSPLQIALYPCGTREGAFAYGRNNSFWLLPNMQFVGRMDPQLRRYLAYAVGRSQRTDFLRALEEEPAPEILSKIYERPHNVWETAVWLNVSGRRLVRQADGYHRIVRQEDVKPTDSVLPNELLPCEVKVRDNGEFTIERGSKHNLRLVYDRGDPKENERALREAMPAWYEGILPGHASIETERFLLRNRQAFIISPPKRAQGRVPWVWYAPTLPGLPGPEERWMFAQFVEAGIAIAGIDVGESSGSPDGRTLYSALYDELTERRGFAKKPVMLGRSRGGLMTLSWAADHPDKVAGLAGIYPVCNIASFPGITNASAAYGLAPDQLARDLKLHNPLDRLSGLAKARVPLFAIHGDNDSVVPLRDNSGAMKERYEALGGEMRLLVSAGQGHSYWPGFFQCQELVDFVIRESRRANLMR